MSNTNFQTIHQMGNAITNVMKQAMGRDNVQNIDMDFVTVAQRKRLVEEIITGNPVTFVTNIVGPLDYLIAQINPVQDLNGQDSPYPAGGEINQFDPDNSSEYTIGTDTRNGHEYTTPGTYAVSAYGSGDSCYIMARVKNSDDTWEAVNYIVHGTVATIGAVFTITEGQKLYVYDGSEHTATVSEGLFNSWQLQVALSSTIPNEYHPYSNICPISGWDSVQITRTGKNLCKSLAETTSFRNVTFTLNNDGTVKANRTDSYNGNSYVAMQEIILPAGTYKCSGSVGGSSSTYWLDFVFDNTAHVQYDSEIEITLEKETTIVPWLNVHKNYSASNVVFYPMIRLSTENDATYEKYAGQVYPISLPTTAYGGSLTVNRDGSGRLVADVARYIVPSASEITGQSSGLNYVRAMYGLDEIVDNSSTANVLSDRLKSVSFNDTRTKWSIYSLNGGSTYGKTILIILDANTTVAEYNEKIAGNAIYAKLATPITMDFTAQQIRSLLGENNIWTNTGNVTVTYKNYEEVI